MDKNYLPTFDYCTLEQGNGFSKSVLNSLLISYLWKVQFTVSITSE